MYGVGPLYVGGIAVITLAAVLLRNRGVFASGRLERLRTVFAVPGIVCIVGGIVLWIYAAALSGIDDGIRENRLVTGGAYALVRNPIYSAAMILCTGVILFVGNAWFFGLPPLYWLVMTVLMKGTEEKWLRELYGREYDDYCARVNRCWPWFPRGAKGK